MDGDGLWVVDGKIILTGVKHVKSFHWFRRPQVLFHESHERPVFDEWQVKNPFGCGCLPVLSCVISSCTW